jgi:hypothetical protein
MAAPMVPIHARTTVGVDDPGGGQLRVPTIA